jgi:hypothetical protein
MVKLHTGETMELGADGYTEAEGYLIFSVLVNATVEEKAELETLWGVRHARARRLRWGMNPDQGLDHSPSCSISSGH